jgi:hypothetical protein
VSEVHPSPVQVDAALGEVTSFRNRLRDLINQHHGDDPRRALLVAEVLAFDVLEDRLRALLVHRRVPGEVTDPSVRRMRGNRGYRGRP